MKNIFIIYEHKYFGHIISACILSIIICFATIAHASDIYQYKDSSGRTVYTNKPVKGAKKVDLPPLSEYAAPMTSRDIQSKSYTGYSDTKATTGKITSNNMSTNEQGRNKVLREELNREIQALKDSKQALNEGKKIHLGAENSNPSAYETRVQALQDAVTEHQKNIDILSKQLGQ